MQLVERRNYRWIQLHDLATIRHTLLQRKSARSTGTKADPNALVGYKPIFSRRLPRIGRPTKAYNNCLPKALIGSPINIIVRELSTQMCSDDVKVVAYVTVNTGPNMCFSTWESQQNIMKSHAKALAGGYDTSRLPALVCRCMLGALYFW